MIGPLFKLFGSGWGECSQIMKTENTREKNVHKLCLVTLTGGRPVSSGNSVRIAGSCCCCRRQFWNIFGQTILSKTIWIIVAVFGVSFVVDLVSFIFFVHIHSTRRIFSTEAVAIFFVVIKDVNPGMPKRSQFFACNFIWIISLTQHQNSHQWINCSILTTIKPFGTLVREVIYGDDQ